HIARSSILLDKFFNRLGIKRIEWPLLSRLVVKRPELFIDVPGHEKFATAYRWPGPTRSLSDPNPRRQRLFGPGPSAQIARSGEIRFCSSARHIGEISCNQYTINVSSRGRRFFDLDIKLG